MNLLFKLTLAQLRRSRMRLSLSLLAMTVTVSLVVWLIGSYDSMVAEFDDEAELYMGEYQWTVGPKGGGGSLGGLAERPVDSGVLANRRGGGRSAFLPSDIIKRLADDSDVEELAGAIQTRVSMVNASKYRPGYVPMREQIGPQRDPYLVGIDAPLPRFPITAGHWFDTEKTMEGVLGSAAADHLKIHVGDSLYINATAGEFFITVVGIVEQTRSTPGVNMRGGGGGPASSSLFVSLPTAAQINGYSNRFNLVYLKLKPEVDKQSIKTRFADAPFAFCDARDLKDRFATDRAANTLKSQANAATGMALLGAVFIIFTTLSMGVSERIRQLAILRAVGLTRRQTAGLIFMESLLLAIPAWLLGLLGGSFLVMLLQSGRIYLEISTFHFSPSALWFSGVAAIVGALLAAVFPAWQAARTDPLDAMKPVAIDPVSHARLSRRLCIIGLLLILVNPILVLVPGLSYELRQMLYVSVGYGTLALGFLCMAPMLIRITEIVFVPVVSRILGFNGAFLKRQFSGNLWRTVGTAVALTVGLSLYTSIQFWGYTMVVPFLPDRSVPDAVAVFMPTGVPESEIDTIRNLPGVDSTAFLVLAGEQAKFSDAQRKSEAMKQVNQDNLLLLGLDLERAFEGNDPMFKLEFVRGNLADALKRMRSGRACLIPNELYQPSGLDVGSMLELVPPNAPSGSVVKYEVAGVVSIPGWHWLSKHSGLRRRGGFTAGMAFAADSMIRRDFKLTNADMFWFNMTPGTDPAKLEAALTAIAERHPGQPVNVPGVGEIAAKRPYVKVTTVEGIAETVGGLADRSIDAMSRMPLIALLIAVLAVVNTMLASMRARMWSLGVIRSVGVTRSMMVRMVLAESLMIGLIACILSFGFGLVAGKCAVDICRWGYHFGGVTATLQIPWVQLSFGFGLTLLLCAIAAVIPAWIAGRAEPLDLLVRSERD